MIDNILLISEKELLASGYKKYKDSRKTDTTYTGSFQKCFWDEMGKAFYLNFCFNDYSKDSLFAGQQMNRHHWTADLQFNSLEDDMTVNVGIFSADKKTLPEIESFVQKMFSRMHFQHYEHQIDTESYQNIMNNRRQLQESFEEKSAINSKIEHQSSAASKTLKV